MAASLIKVVWIVVDVRQSRVRVHQQRSGNESTAVRSISSTNSTVPSVTDQCRQAKQTESNRKLQLSQLARIVRCPGQRRTERSKWMSHSRKITKHDAEMYDSCNKLSFNSNMAKLVF